MTFTPSQLGVNINIRSIRGFELDVKKTLATIYALPVAHVRIPIPFDIVSPKEGIWDFSETDWIIGEALKHTKKIHLQFGMKTIGWPEVNIPQWLYKKYPELRLKGLLDSNPEIQTLILDYLKHAAIHYRKTKHLASVHVENEAFSKRLHASSYRYLSREFNEKEVKLIKKYFPRTPLIQNAPFDSLEFIPYVISHHDITGLNIYPQVQYPFTGQFFYWLMIQGVFLLAKYCKKQVYITEYQTGAWLNNKQEPTHPFTIVTFIKYLDTLLSLNAKIVFLWDVEQVIWMAKNGDKTHLATIESLCV